MLSMKRLQGRESVFGAPIGDFPWLLELECRGSRVGMFSCIMMFLPLTETRILMFAVSRDRDGIVGGRSVYED